MAVPLSEKKREIYHLSRLLVVECYALSEELHQAEKTKLTVYLRDAAITVFINIAQGVFIKKKKRKQYFETALESLLVIDAAMEVFAELKLAGPGEIELVKQQSSLCYKKINALLKKQAE